MINYNFSVDLCKSLFKMNHHAHREVDEMVHQLGMQTRKSHRQQQSPDELMKQLEFATKKPRRSVKPPGALKPRNYVYCKINRSPYTIRKKHIHSSEDRDHSSTTSCAAPEATGKSLNLIICFLRILVCMHAVVVSSSPLNKLYKNS